MTKKLFNKLNVAIVLPLIVGIVLISAGFPHGANAASLTNLRDTMSSLKINTLSSHKIEFAVATSTAVVGSGKTFTITFPAQFNFTGKTLTGMTISHGGINGTNTSGTLNAAPGAGNQWGAVFSGTNLTVLTLTVPTAGVSLVPTDKIVVTYNNVASLNPPTAGPYTIALAGTAGDTGSILMNILNDDQVLVSATVPQTISFSLSGNTVGFGTMTPGTPRYANPAGTGSATEILANNAVVATNAAGGYNLSYNGPTLTSPSLHTIAAIGGTSAAPNAGVEQFGLRAVGTGGAGTVQAPYVSAQFAFVPGSAQTLALSTTASDATTYDIRYLANVISTTDAGAYSTAITYTATANY